MRKPNFAVLCLMVLLTVLAVASAAPAQTAQPVAKQPKEVKKSERLREAVTPGAILVHQQRFQAIADANGNTRASGTPGYDASVDYVVGQLEEAGYDVTVQPFTFKVFTENEPSELEQTAPDATPYVYDEDFATMNYSGSGDVTATVQAVDTDAQPNGASTSGCEAEDFAGFTAGNIALMQRGTCTFAIKAENAEAAGASAVLIFNRGTEGNTGVINGTLGEESDVAIPVLGLDFETGADLADPEGTTARVFTDTQTETKETANVLADTPGGNPANTVVVGAHLDSVPEGPGINDNGSGSSTILEIARQMSELKIEPRNKVRFAFWGAEESGLLGSTYYVSQLSDEELDDIALNLNFDMVGSPNYVRFVYDGDGSEGTAGPPGSAQIEQTFNSYFASQGLETEPTAFDGRSDYKPFIDVGIPAGGLFSGAEGVKTEEQAAIYGGVAGVAYDPCYHQACDDLTNLNFDALDELSDAAAHATLTYAEAKYAPGEEKPKGPVKGTKSSTFAGPNAVR